MEGRKFCGKTQDEMREILFFMSDVEDELELDEHEKDMYDTAIQCIAVIVNRMIDDRPIMWDDD